MELTETLATSMWASSMRPWTEIFNPPSPKLFPADYMLLTAISSVELYSSQFQKIPLRAITQRPLVICTVILSVRHITLCASNEAPSSFKSLGRPPRRFPRETRVKPHGVIAAKLNSASAIIRSHVHTTAYRLVVGDIGHEAGRYDESFLRANEMRH